MKKDFGLITILRYNKQRKMRKSFYVEINGA
jgi:hypothetical protein